MIDKDLDSIGEADLQSLVDNRVLELKGKEYKATLPTSEPSSKKQFLASVSSFANASGGDLIIGIREDPKTHEPEELAGVSVHSWDQEILRLDNLIRDGIEPRLPASTYAMRPLPLSNGQSALLIRVQRSWVAPHRVSIGGHNQFYARGPDGKHQMDVSELRTAFTFAGELSERIRRFREDRLSRTLAREGPWPLVEGAKIVLHLIPVESFDRPAAFDVEAVAQNKVLKQKLDPIAAGMAGQRYNVDGLLSYGTDGEGQGASYVQLFRTGVIEAVDAWLLRTRFIPSVLYEKRLIEATSQYLALLKALGVFPPILVCLAMLGVKEYPLALSHQRQSLPIDRDTLLLPDSLVRSYDEDPAHVLRDCFNAVWNAGGLPKSLNYDEDGQWSPS